MGIGQKKGFRHSEISKKQISETMKRLGNLPNRFQKGIAPPKAFKEGHIPWNKGKKCFSISVSKLGNKNPMWKGGQKIDQGYVWIYMPEHPFANKRYVKRARLVMEKHLKRYLKPKEIVHHKGIKYPIRSIKNRQDDRIDNLQLFPTRSEHMKYHRPNLPPSKGNTHYDSKP